MRYPLTDGAAVAAAVKSAEVVGSTPRAGQFAMKLNLISGNYLKEPLIYNVNYQTGLSLRLGQPPQRHLGDRHRLTTMFLHHLGISWIAQSFDSHFEIHASRIGIATHTSTEYRHENRN